MNNPSIVIDAGHGGTDGGATGNGIVEKDLTLLISKYMDERFKQLGIPVTMTRTTDETVSPTERVKRIVEAYGDRPGVIVISNHINAGGGDGAEVIYALRNTNKLPDLILKEIENSGQNIRDSFQRRLPSDTAKDYYFIHRDTGKNTQPLIVEYGFLDSTGDDVSQLKNNYKRYAEAVVKAVTEYLGKTYIPPVGSGQTTYTVKNGDSLWSIANKYNTSVAALKAANNLTTNDLRVGQVLVIPTAGVIPPSNENNTVYVVLPGDSLYSIANKYNTTVSAIKSLNQLTNDSLRVGQSLLIPGTGNSQPPINPPSTGETTYTVKSGDSLWNIANRYNTTVDALMKYNNLSSNLLNVGQVIKIPVENSETTYTVKSGDSLWNIANRYNTTVDEIKRKNNLNTNSLTIGQILKI